MKAKVLTLMLACSLPFVGLYAGKKVTKGQKAPQEEAKQEEVAEEAPQITEECLINVSLFNESAKNKQYADAVEPWYSVFNTCPTASLAIYQRGTAILEWQYKQATSEEQKNQIRNTLMELYDKRIKYFGDNAKYPTPYILGEKAMDYVTYFPEDELKEQAYNWLSQSLDGMGAKSKVSVIQQFARLSYGLYKADNSRQQQYIADYQKASDLLNAIAADETNKESARDNARAVKDEIDQIFANSGAADVEKMDEIYESVVEASLDDQEKLGKIMRLYQRTENTDSKVYFTAAVASHKIKPTAESAAGCAAMSRKSGDKEGAINYYLQAAELAEDPADKAEYLYSVAYCYYDLKNYTSCRTYARRSLENLANQGRCYILIGLAYANGPKPYDDPILNRSIYWVAVDKFQKAASVDPSVAATANKYVATYRQYFPSTEDIFYSPDLKKGESFNVGGWIGETTTVRSSD